MLGLQTIKNQADVTHDSIPMSRDSRFRAAMVLAVIADALQIVVFPLFVEGAASPADDILDLGIGALLVRLLGWQVHVDAAAHRTAGDAPRSRERLPYDTTSQW